MRTTADIQNGIKLDIHNNRKTPKEGTGSPKMLI